MSATGYATTLNDLHENVSVITTEEELDDLPAWSVILSSENVAWQKEPTGYWFTGGLLSANTAKSLARYLPGLLLWRGDKQP